MPIFQDDDAANFKGNGGGFQFSGININQLTGASAYTLVGLACDRSSSVTSFASDIERCVKETIKACQKSARADNLLVRTLAFGTEVTEEHGFRPLMNCTPDKYDGFLKPGGRTLLYDASVDLVDSLATYGKSLMEQDYTANGIVVIVTDGADYTSAMKAHHVKEALQRARQSESLESIVSILIGINVKEPEISNYLKGFKDEAGFDQYIEAPDVSSQTMAKITGFVSRSISSQSMAVGSGGPSALITF